MMKFKSIVGAVLWMGLNGTTNAMDVPDAHTQNVDIHINFHPSRQAEQIRVIVKNATDGQLVKQFNQEGTYQLPLGTYTFSVSGMTKYYPLEDLTQAGVRDMGEDTSETRRVEAPCEVFSAENPHQDQGKIIVDPSNVMVPIMISVAEDEVRGIQGADFDANKIRCQVVRAEGIVP